jgi:hypothetical protein
VPSFAASFATPSHKNPHLVRRIAQDRKLTDLHGAYQVRAHNKTSDYTANLAKDEARSSQIRRPAARITLVLIFVNVAGQLYRLLCRLFLFGHSS